MNVYELAGLYAPARLGDELRTAGIDCAGVTATTDDAGAVVAVQVIVDDDSTLEQVEAVAAVHDPAPPAPPAEDLWQDVRERRDTQLLQTDWIVAPPPDTAEATLADIAANQPGWNDFRQALRDLPGSATDPAELVWPTPPAAPTVTLVAPPPFVAPVG